MNEGFKGVGVERKIIRRMLVKGHKISVKNKIKSASVMIYDNTFCS